MLHVLSVKPDYKPEINQASEDASGNLALIVDNPDGFSERLLSSLDICGHYRGLRTALSGSIQRDEEFLFPKTAESVDERITIELHFCGIRCVRFDY